MTLQLIDLINNIMVPLYLRDNKTAIQDGDGSKWFRSMINKGLEWIYDHKPPLVELGNTLTLPALTQTVTLPSNIPFGNIHTYSWKYVTSSGDQPLRFVTEQFILNNFANYRNDTSDYPTYIYLQNGQPCFYPRIKTGSASLTIRYQYTPLRTRLVNPTDVLPFEDGSLEIRFLEHFCTYKYEMIKGFGQPDDTLNDLTSIEARLIARYSKNKQISIASTRSFKRG